MQNNFNLIKDLYRNYLGYFKNILKIISLILAITILSSYNDRDPI